MEHEKTDLQETPKGEHSFREQKQNNPAHRKKTRKNRARTRQSANEPRPRPRRVENAEVTVKDEPEIKVQQENLVTEESPLLVEQQDEFLNQEILPDALEPLAETQDLEESNAEERLNDEEHSQENSEVVQEPKEESLIEPIVEEKNSQENLEKVEIQEAEQKQPDFSAQKQQDDEDLVQPSKKHHFAFYMGWFTLAFTLCSVVLIAALFLFSGNPLFTTAEDVNLPNFTQMTREEVEDNPNFSTFKLQFEEEYNSEVDEGIIFDQSPKPPKKVKENSVITLRVSKGVEYVEIPDVSGWKWETAKEKLKELGVDVLIRYEENDDFEEDTVIRTDPDFGETVQTGTTVSLYVSQQETLKESNVPNCVGKSYSEATTMLMERKLKVKVVRRDSTSAKGTVLSQSPQPGILLNAGETVTLYVSSGEPEVPDVTETGHVHSWSPPDENGYQFCYVCLETRKAPE
ncbi:PASTA domain-containing protein [uncultured Ruthenibacterium sp.]|uniref:PASTA domain-containing protein n=1 Tax=uncultured Ruthenibacterium sp. TaxID=1905347 RepID=UPI00349EAA62